MSRHGFFDGRRKPQGIDVGTEIEPDLPRRRGLINVAAMFKSFDHNISPPFHKDAALLKMDRIDVSPAGKGGGQRADEAFFDIKAFPFGKKDAGNGPAVSRIDADDAGLFKGRLDEGRKIGLFEEDLVGQGTARRRLADPFRRQRLL